MSHAIYTQALKSRNLQAYIKQHNAFDFWPGFVAMPVAPMTSAEMETIRQKLECDLSPENLHCDGEISANQVRIKARMLNGAMSELAVLEGML